jgi:putative hydrolase of the HAD superfamily
MLFSKIDNVLWKSIEPHLPPHKPNQVALWEDTRKLTFRQSTRVGENRSFLFVVAGEFNVSKPCMEIFEIACKRNGKEPEKCFYVGDVIETDIIPCEKIRMKGIWINRNNKILLNKNIKSIISLKELSNVLCENMP